MLIVTRGDDSDESRSRFHRITSVYQKTEICPKLSRNGKIKFISGTLFTAIILFAVRGVDNVSGL